MLNKKIIGIVLLLSISLASCDNPFEQNYLDRKSKIETFLAYDGEQYYYFQRVPLGIEEEFNDDNHFVMDSLKRNTPKEVSHEYYSEFMVDRVIDDINYVMISYEKIGDSNKKYRLTLFSSYVNCIIEADNGLKFSWQGSTRYYLLEESVGKQIYDFVRKQL